MVAVMAVVIRMGFFVVVVVVVVVGFFYDFFFKYRLGDMHLKY
jgi:hypothetical protein